MLLKRKKSNAEKRKRLRKDFRFEDVNILNEKGGVYVKMAKGHQEGSSGKRGGAHPTGLALSKLIWCFPAY